MVGMEADVPSCHIEYASPLGGHTDGCTVDDERLRRPGEEESLFEKAHGFHVGPGPRPCSNTNTNIVAFNIICSSHISDTTDAATVTAAAAAAVAVVVVFIVVVVVVDDVSITSSSTVDRVTRSRRRYRRKRHSALLQQ
jgi:hypothetical protein